MERLTFDGSFCDIAKCAETPGGSFCENGACSQRKVWERLKDYEDTGLTPAEVRSMHGEWQAMMSVLNSIGGYDRLRELAEADKAGRVMVLKCKPGDAVYFIKAVFQWAKEPIEAQIIIISCDFYGCIYTAAKTGWTQVRRFSEEEIGKTVFLTREEAEKALEEVKRHG